MFMNKPAREGTNLHWHQDRWSELDREPQITIYTALDPATIENGCVRIIPKSHRTFVSRLHGDAFYEQVEETLAQSGSIPLELEAGEVVLLHNWLLHSSGVNQTDIPRRAFSVCYMHGGTKSSRGNTFSLIFGDGALSVNPLKSAQI
jgi:ectoine hydroxylase-related dioxygenase (phytanoyl-CoA dioxygenase family)